MVVSLSLVTVTRHFCREAPVRHPYPVFNRRQWRSVHRLELETTTFAARGTLLLSSRSATSAVIPPIRRTMERRSSRWCSGQRYAWWPGLRRRSSSDGIQVLWYRDRSAAVELVSHSRRWIYRARLALLGPRGVVGARPSSTRLRRFAVLSADRFESRPRQSRDRADSASQWHHTLCSRRRQGWV